MLSGSVIMLAQAFEGGADLLASGLLLIGVKRSKKPSDRKHPFGYGRELYFWTFLSALASLVITAGISFYLGLQRFLHPEPLYNITIAIIVLCISIATNGYAFSLSARRLISKGNGKKIWEALVHSGFIATKTTLILDLMGTTASILGLIALGLYALTGNAQFDGIGAMAIGITLALLTSFIIKGAKDMLVGQSAAVDVEEKIKTAALSFSSVQKILDLRTLQIGPEYLLVNMEIHVKNALTTDEIEILVDKMESAIKEKVLAAKHIQIELETPDRL